MKVARKQYGMTLLELMIAVAIVGILGAIAYPSYLEHVASSRRADVQANLLALAQHMERQFTENSTYAGSVLPYNQAPKDGADKYYSLTISASTATSYTLQASPINGMAGDRCGNMTISNISVKTATGGNDCW